MESKNIKVIDEHSIDRNANIICAIDVDGSDYAVYWIERDSENDNIFISKLLKNIDGTSSMINIEDSMEKSKMADIVKELIKFSIDSGANSVEGNSVSLPSGKVVGISSVLINKEQYINVQKTYITTVKKSVTKVSEDFYNIKEKVESAPVVDVFPVVEPVLPEVNVVAPEVVPEVSVAPVEPTQVVEPVTATIPNVVANEPVLPEEPVVPTPVAPVVEPKVDVVQEVAATVAIPSVPIVETPVVETASVVEPAVEPVIPSTEPSQLIFDASKESNLNMALGEVSAESKISAPDVSSIREFGEEEPKVASVVTETPVANTESVAVSSNGQSGFANNKFFMFIAIAFFLASCVFLGYEVFNYFQLVK